jgi:hypothetical protein
VQRAFCALALCTFRGGSRQIKSWDAGINYESSGAVEVLLAALCYCVPLFQNKIKEYNSGTTWRKVLRERASERARAFVLLKT